jgi:glutamate-1-semialdehyde 2,1-aminomutase
MSLQGERTRALYQKGKQYIPYGVNSNFRYWGEEDTLVVVRGEGPYLWDADENRYIDYRLGFGPLILGHCHPYVIQRVEEVLHEGTIFAWMTPREVELAERIAKMCKVDKVRLANSGTEATMHALRIARAYTGREKFIKFEGHYHGMHDYVLFSTASSQKAALGSRRSPIPQQISSGIPMHIREYVYCLPFNDLDMLERTVEAHWGELAAILFEPMMGNTAGIMPVPGYLEKIRDLCDRYGIVMVMDEVKTGFRLANGGAQEYFGVRSDLVTYAKALGNGFPIAAIAGKEEVMMTVHPGQVSHGGTYTGNGVGTAAALAVLDMLENEPVIERTAANGQRLMQGIDRILTEADIPHSMSGAPTMFGFALGSDKPPRDFREYVDSDRGLYEELGYALIRRGVMPDGDGREPWFLSYSHNASIIDETLNIFQDAVREVARNYKGSPKPEIEVVE